VVRNDFSIDQVVQLWARQLDGRHCPAGRVGRVGEVRRWHGGGPRRNGWRYRLLHWNKCTIEGVPPVASVAWME
jgi:hypothetical protein